MKMVKKIVMTRLSVLFIACSLLMWNPLGENITYAANNTANGEKITADGYGVLPTGIPIGRAKIMGRRAAIVDAQRNLVETIQGTAVDSETTVNNFILTDDVVKTKVSGLIKGATVVDEELLEDNMYRVVMSVPMYGVGSVAEIAYDAVIGNNQPQNIPMADNAFIESYTPAENMYTGLVIDASGSELEKTFCPAIYDTNGRVIYGVNNVDKDYAISNGIVEYSNNINSLNTRAGVKPIVIKIVSLKPRVVNKCDVIISVDDADRLLAENQRSHFLDKYAVVFVK